MANPITIADLRKKFNLTPQQFASMRRHNPGFPNDVGWVHVEYQREGTPYKWKQKTPVFPEDQAVKWVENAIKCKGKSAVKKAEIIQADRFDNSAALAFLSTPSALRPRAKTSDGKSVTVRTDGVWR
jgi:hypothetical protein